jgi:hypothetical protein
MDRLLARVVLSAAAVIAALILIATATVFLCVALYLFLISLSAAPALAALVTGLTVLLLAALILLAARVATRRRSSGETRAAGRDPAGNINDLAAQLGGLAAHDLASQAQAHPYRAFAVSLLAGLAVGGSPELRKLLAKLLKDQ